LKPFDLLNLQMTSCIRCKTSILGNPKEHLDTCNQLERFDQASAQLYQMGYESLSLDQIGLLVEDLIATDLSGYDRADRILAKTQPLASHDSDWQDEANDGSFGTAKWT
jgi:hypothetical protein